MDSLCCCMQGIVRILFLVTRMRLPHTLLTVHEGEFIFTRPTRKLVLGTLE